MAACRGPQSTVATGACKAGSVRTITGHAGQQTLAALRPFGVDMMFTLNGGHVWPLLRRRPRPGRARRRHPPRADRDVRRRGLRQAHPVARAGRADRRTRHHQRGLGDHDGVVQRLAGRRARRAGAAGAVGRRLAAGARPRADRRLDHQARRRPSPTPSKAGLVVHEAARAGHDAAPRARCSSTSRSTCSGRPKASCPTPCSLTRRGARPGRPSTPSAALIAGAERPAFIVGSDVYWAGAWDALAAAAERAARARASSTASAAAACPPTTSWPSCGPAACSSSEADLVVVRRHAARLPPRLRPLRRRPGRPRRRRRQPAGRGTSRCRRPPATWPPS